MPHAFISIWCLRSEFNSAHVVSEVPNNVRICVGVSAFSLERVKVPVVEYVFVTATLHWSENPAAMVVSVRATSGLS